MRTGADCRCAIAFAALVGLAAAQGPVWAQDNDDDDDDAAAAGPTAEQVTLLGTPGRSSGMLADTTPRELQTLAMLAEGKPYAQIASDLGVSYKTVVNTSSRLKAKLGARNLPELIRMAIQYVSSSSEYGGEGPAR
jgi:DNA-binding CsgD family transcriptional regulator